MDLSKLFLYSLYFSNKKIQEDVFGSKINVDDWYDQNVYKIMDYFLQNNSLDDLKSLLSSNKHQIKANYDIKNNEYYNEFFEGSNSLNYFGASLAYDQYGLQKSQLKTLTSIFKSIKLNNKFISVNGGPGTGKSTLLNYVISNILIDSLIVNYYSFKKKNNKNSFSYFFKNNYMFPKLFLTGTTKIAVDNISDVCAIKPPKHHRWIYLDSNNDYINKKIDDLFYSLDNKISKNNEDETTVINPNDGSLNQYIKEIKANYIDSFVKKFKTKNIEWKDICDYLFKELESNIIDIKNINKNIEDIFDKSIQDNMDIYLKEIYLKNIFNSIINELKSLLNEKLSKKDKIKKYQEKIERNLDILKSNIDTNNKEVKEKLELIEDLISKFNKLDNKFLFLKTNKSINKKINEINKSIEDLINKNNNNIYSYFDKLNKAIDSIKKMFSKEELEELSLDKVEKFKSDSNKEMLLDMLSSLDIIKINFNIIQQRIDTFYRTENIYLYRHICEWLFIEKKFDDLHCIRPIISANLQKLSMWKVNNEIWKTKTNKFDYTIIDEAGQTSSKFIPFLATISKRVLAVGDEIQLSPIENNEIIKNIKTLKEKVNNDEINRLNDFLTNDLNLFIKNKYNKLVFKYNSLLEWINENSNTVSTIATSSDSYTTKNGLFILEHFRCPYQIFSLVNEFFYNNGLVFAKGFSEDKCYLSKIISNDLTCDESSLIQIKYDNDSIYDDNSNAKELEIGFNFIIDNIKNFLNHNKEQKDLKINEKDIDYLKNNIAFVTLYKNQSDNMKSIVNMIISEINNSSYSDKKSEEMLSKIVSVICSKIRKYFDKEEQKLIVEFLQQFKCGTVDSLQGIGCDFVIFSNVSDHYKTKKDYIKLFEFDKNRTNVLWTRTKKHFIHIISNNYWKNISNENIDEIEFRFESEITSNKLNLSRIIFDIKDNNLSNFSINNLLIKYKEFQDIKRQINEIGKYGELVFNKISNDQAFSKVLSRKLYDEIGVLLSFDNNIKWENQDNEKYLEWDFIIDNYFIDVKASKKKESNKIIISREEWEFGKKQKDKYFIAKINDITKYNININNESSKAFVLNNISFYKIKDNILKNNNDRIFYVFRDEI